MATKTDLIGVCPWHGEYFMDTEDSPCPTCEDGHTVEACAICGTPVIFDGSDEYPDVHEYDVCDECGAHVCRDCVVYPGERNTTPYCPNCYRQSVRYF